MVTRSAKRGWNFSVFYATVAGLSHSSKARELHDAVAAGPTSFRLLGEELSEEESAAAARQFSRLMVSIATADIQ